MCLCVYTCELVPIRNSQGLPISLAVEYDAGVYRALPWRNFRHGWGRYNRSESSWATNRLSIEDVFDKIQKVFSCVASYSGLGNTEGLTYCANLPPPPTPTPLFFLSRFPYSWMDQSISLAVNYYSVENHPSTPQNGRKRSSNNKPAEERCQWKGGNTWHTEGLPFWWIVQILSDIERLLAKTKLFYNVPFDLFYCQFYCIKSN